MLIFSYLLRNKDGSFSAGVSMLTQAEYGINGFLVEIRKRCSFSARVSMLTRAEYGLNGLLVEIQKRS